MPAIEMIVCESRGGWAAVLRRELPGRVHVVESRSREELFGLLERKRWALVAIELAHGRQQPVLEALERLRRQFPKVVFVVLADRASAEWEFLLREAGTTHFLDSARRLDEVVAIAARLLEGADYGGDSSAGSLEEQAVASLPWSE